MICYRVIAAANLKNVILKKTRLKIKVDRARTITQVRPSSNGAGLEFKMLKTTKFQSFERNISIDKFYDLSFQQQCI